MNNIDKIIESISINYGLSKHELYDICWNLFSNGISNMNNISNSILIYIEKINRNWKLEDI
jgi:hypothetical protein